MKRILPLLLGCLLLLGCSQDPRSGVSTPTSPTEATAPVTEQLYDPDFSLSSDPESVCFPLGSSGNNRFFTMGDKLVRFTGYDDRTVITVYVGKELTKEAQTDIPLPDFEADPSIRVTDSGISYFDYSTGLSHFLDTHLRSVRQIALPEDLSGIPLMSDDGSQVYYSTDSAIRVLDGDSHLSRVIREISSQVSGVTALLLDGSVLQWEAVLDGQAQTMFVSAENGALLGKCKNPPDVWTAEDRYFVSLLDRCSAPVPVMKFGTVDSEARMLCFRQGAELLCCLPGCDRVISTYHSSDTGETILELYQVETGMRTAQWTATPSESVLQAVTGPDGNIYLLVQTPSEDVLYLWDTDKWTMSDVKCYSFPYSTPDSPDLEALEQCRQYAMDISQRTGIQILVGADSVAFQPEDYTLEQEYLAPLLYRELEALDERLRQFPEGFLSTLASNFDSINICLVRSVTGNPGYDVLHTAAGLQFWDGPSGYIALCTSQDTSHTLYHELNHLIDTRVIGNCNAYDNWNKFNPSGFTYDNDYTVNRNRDGSQYLTPGSQTFIDTYSMSFAKEDRARIFEYAMTPGHQDLFDSSILQSKLKQMCTAIRESFDLEKSTETFLWEQYLWTPLSAS